MDDDKYMVDKDKLLRYDDEEEDNEIIVADNSMFDFLNDDVVFLIYKTKEKINSSLTSTTSIFQKSLIKSWVSQKKNRFQYEGFDLDLTYIIDNVIAMGFPASDFQSLFRNNVKDVIRFFEKRHPNSYKVYNLCSEKSYPENTFLNQASYGFDDHEAPPINLIYPFCKDAKDFIKKDPNNVIAVHCKAGKGRTGVFICCYLLYRNIFKKADDAISYFGLMRLSNGRGLTVPSQLRYVYYFENILKEDLGYPIDCPKMLLSKIKFYTIPSICKGGETYFNVISKEDNLEYTSEKYSMKNDQPMFEFPGNKLVVSGDVRIVFLIDFKFSSKNKLMKFWFNTNFIPKNGALVIEKSMLDWACKDKENKLFDSNFKIELQFIMVENF